MVTKEQLIVDGFELRTYPDGLFWLLFANKDLFIQVDEALTDITLYDGGWVENNLTNEEYTVAVSQIKNWTKESDNDQV